MRPQQVLFALIIHTLISYGCIAQKSNPNYDQALAEKVGADDYGMKSYIFVMLKTGPNTSEDPETREAAFAGHMANMKRLGTKGDLILAGPLGTNDNQYRGIFILNVKTKEEAQALLQTDPAIKAEYLVADLYDWYGSAAISEYKEASDRVWKVGF